MAKMSAKLFTAEQLQHGRITTGPAVLERRRYPRTAASNDAYIAQYNASDAERKFANALSNIRADARPQCKSSPLAMGLTRGALKQSSSARC
jgi:hypothetical protein